jgi:hypothetical protein
MHTKLSVILASVLMLLSGCKGSLLRCDYAKRVGKEPGSQPRSDLVDVQIKIKKGLTQTEPPRSITTPFVVEGEIIKGQIPKHRDVKCLRLRLYHDWTDTLIRDNATLTPRFTQDGFLFDIKEFVVTDVGK